MLSAFTRCSPLAAGCLRLLLGLWADVAPGFVWLAAALRATSAQDIELPRASAPSNESSKSSITPAAKDLDDSSATEDDSATVTPRRKRGRRFRLHGASRHLDSYGVFRGVRRFRGVRMDINSVRIENCYCRIRI